MITTSRKKTKYCNQQIRFFHIENMEAEMPLAGDMPMNAANFKQAFVSFVNRSAMVWFVICVILLVIVIILSITVAVQKGMINRRNVTIAVEQSKTD